MAQQVAARTAAWLSGIGLRIPPPTIQQMPNLDVLGPGYVGAQAYVDPQGRQIIANAANVRIWAGLQQRMRGRARRPMSAEAMDQVGALNHELIHTGSKSLATQTPDQRFWEEGITEAVSADVLPAALRQLYGARGGRNFYKDARYTGSFPGRVKSIRQMSVYATGAGKWNDRAARVWRRDLANADADQRAQMMAAVNAIRAQR